MIVQRTKTYAVCPTCQQDAGSVDHLLGQKFTTWWYCDACGHRYCLEFKVDGEVVITRAPGRKITTLDVLKLPPQPKPVFFVVQGMRFEDGPDGGERDIAASKTFFYESHSCPTNWLEPVMMYYDGDSDPHGVIEFVRSRDEGDLPPDESVSPNDHDRALVALIELGQIGSGTDSSQRSTRLNGQERSALEKLVREIKKLPALFPDDLFQAITQAEDVLGKEKNLGGHESHGGRSDLEPAAPSTASHDATSTTD
jgi:hypothetical protein